MSEYEPFNFITVVIPFVQLQKLNKIYETQLNLNYN